MRLVPPLWTFPIVVILFSLIAQGKGENYAIEVNATLTYVDFVGDVSACKLNASVTDPLVYCALNWTICVVPFPQNYLVPEGHTIIRENCTDPKNNRLKPNAIRADEYKLTSQTYDLGKEGNSDLVQIYEEYLKGTIWHKIQLESMGFDASVDTLFAVAEIQLILRNGSQIIQVGERHSLESRLESQMLKDENEFLSEWHLRSNLDLKHKEGDVHSYIINMRMRAGCKPNYSGEMCYISETSPTYEPTTAELTSTSIEITSAMPTTASSNTVMDQNITRSVPANLTALVSLVKANPTRAVHTGVIVFLSLLVPALTLALILFLFKRSRGKKMRMEEGILYSKYSNTSFGRRSVAGSVAGLPVDQDSSEVNIGYKPTNNVTFDNPTYDLKGNSFLWSRFTFGTHKNSV